MLTVLQKYHSAAENLSDTVKQSGDFKIWITIDPNPEFNVKQEDKKQVNVAITPQKTVFELCKELESHMKISAHEMTLMEVIINGTPSCDGLTGPKTTERQISSNSNRKQNSTNKSSEQSKLFRALIPARSLSSRIAKQSQ
jgi:hypothetical protein